MLGRLTTSATLLLLFFCRMATAQVTVFDDRIETRFDTIPRFTPDLRIEADQSLLATGDITHDVIEIHGTYELQGNLTVNTILVMPGGTLRLYPDTTIRFLGDVHDQDTTQWGLGIVCFGHWEALGTPVEPWQQEWSTEEDYPYQYSYEPDRSIKLFTDPDNERPAHTAVLGAGTCDVEYVSFNRVGRTTTDPLDPAANTKARYAFHWHHASTPGSILRGCIFRDWQKWAIDVHNTRGQTVEDNVCIGGGRDGENGAGIATEAGTEASNTIRHNYVQDVFSAKYPPGALISTRQPNDDGFEGHGFWFASITDSTITGNVAWRCGVGFTDQQRHKASSTTLVDGTVVDAFHSIPRDWSDNTAMWCILAGLDSYEGKSKRFPYIRQRCWNCYIAHRGQPGFWWHIEPDFKDCTYGVQDALYSGEIRIYGGRVVGCTNTAFTHSEVVLVDCLLADNRIDINPRIQGSGSCIYARLVDDRIPTVILSNGSSIRYSDVGALFNARRRIETASGKVYDILFPDQLPDAIMPFSRVAEYEPRTNAEMFERYGIWHNYAFNDGDVQYFEQFRQFANRSGLLPTKVYDSIADTQQFPQPSPLQPRITVHGFATEGKTATYFSVSTPQPGDLVRIFVDGQMLAEDRANTRFCDPWPGYLPPFEHSHCSFAGISAAPSTAIATDPDTLVEAALIRGGETVATYSSAAESEPDPLAELLEQLAAAQTALELAEQQQAFLLIQVIAWLRGDDSVDIFEVIDQWLAIDSVITDLEEQIAEIQTAIEALGGGVGH